MGALRLASIILLAGSVTAGCGSTGSGPVRRAPAETGATAVVIAPPETSGAGSGNAAGPTLPARSATDVIALAELHPQGTVLYDVVSPGGTGTIRVSRLGSTGAIERTITTSGSGPTWVGFADSKIVYACTSTSTGDPVCRRGDTSGAGEKAAFGVAKLLGADAVRMTFSQFLGQKGLGFAPDTQLARTVSCMAIAASIGDYRLCVTKDGQITQLNAGATKITATSLAVASPGDVAAPTLPQ